MRRKKKQKASRLMRSNNILVFKLIDPVIQSLLFILFVYCLDTDSSTALMRYGTVLAIIIVFQAVSVLINFIINEPKQLKMERTLYLIVIMLYGLTCYFTKNRQGMQEVISGRGMAKMQPSEIAILSTGLLICFWYYITCFREIRDLLAKAQKDD